MRYTVPWIQPSRGDPDGDGDDELTGNALVLVMMVAIIVSRAGEPLPGEAISHMLYDILHGALDELDDGELVSVLCGSVLLARTLGLVELTRNGSFRATAAAARLMETTRL